LSAAWPWSPHTVLALLPSSPPAPVRLIQSISLNAWFQAGCQTEAHAIFDGALGIARSPVQDTICCSVVMHPVYTSFFFPLRIVAAMSQSGSAVSMPVTARARNGWAQQIEQSGKRTIVTRLKMCVQLCGEGSVSHAVWPDAKRPRLLETVVRITLS